MNNFKCIIKILQQILTLHHGWCLSICVFSFEFVHSRIYRLHSPFSHIFTLTECYVYIIYRKSLTSYCYNLQTIDICGLHNNPCPNQICCLCSLNFQSQKVYVPQGFKRKRKKLFSFQTLGYAQGNLFTLPCNGLLGYYLYLNVDVLFSTEITMYRIRESDPKSLYHFSFGRNFFDIKYENLTLISHRSKACCHF